MEESKQQLIDKPLTGIQGVIQARESKYIMMHAPTERLDEVIALLPGAERPTILPLAGYSTTRSDAHGQQRNPVLGNDGKTESAGCQFNPGPAD